MNINNAFDLTPNKNRIETLHFSLRLCAIFTSKHGKEFLGQNFQNQIDSFHLHNFQKLDKCYSKMSPKSGKLTFILKELTVANCYKHRKSLIFGPTSSKMSEKAEKRMLKIFLKM